MAKRKLQGIGAFFDGFNQAYDTAGRVMTDIELAKIAKETPTTSEGYTEDDGSQIRAMADAKDPEGKPYYLVGTDEAGNYKVTPQFQTGGQPAAPITMAKQGVTDFMGQRTVGKMNDAQVNNARMRAMAGVIAKADPVRGMQMMNDVTRGERDDLRFGWEKGRAERETRKADQEEQDQEALRRVDSDAAQWMEARLKSPDGTARTATVDDYLAASQYRAGALAQAGKLNEAGAAMKDFNAQSLVKIQLETAARDQAIGKTAAALAAGDLGAVRDFYNQYVPDGARVTNVARDERGQITIERETAAGQKLAPTTMKDTGQMVAALESFKNPMALYNWSQNEFKNNLALRQDARDDKRVGFEGQRVGMEGARLDMARDEKAATAPQRQLANTVATLQLAMASTDDPEQRAAIQARLAAVQGGTGDKNEPSEVKLANAALRAGVDGITDMASALQWAVTKKSSSPAELHKSFIEANKKNMMRPADAVKDADETMAAAGYVKKGGQWVAAGAGGAQGIASDPRAIAIRDDKALTVDQKREKLKALGYQ